MRFFLWSAVAGVVLAGIALFIICQPRLCVDIAIIAGLVLAALTVLGIFFLILYTLYKLAVLFFCTCGWLFNTYRNSRTGITRRYGRTIRTDEWNINRLPLREDEIECAMDEARASSLRKLRKELWE